MFKVVEKDYFFDKEVSSCDSELFETVEEARADATAEAERIAPYRYYGNGARGKVNDDHWIFDDGCGTVTEIYVVRI